MFLKRIEINGFKSFADKTVINFEEGLTAVVGPNGSGKSNLSEAIRWVLGEQSARSLRGHRMEDVVFNGTTHRAPVNIAQVTLFLNNEDRHLDYDFNEISISRSYNRNGDSHYLINNERVRLKNVVDLLLDSGFGRNSFGMISQGEIESIFLSRPEDRRSIIEEAAGVQRYQLRKVEASRKLTRSHDHLSRVKDIIHELEEQLTPLAKQRDIALEYQALTTEFEQLEISLLVNEINLFQEERLDKTQQLQTVKEALEQNNQSIQKKNEQLILKHQQLEKLVLALDTQSDQLQADTKKLAELRGQKNMAQQELAFNQSTQQSQSEQKAHYVTRQKELQKLLVTQKQNHEAIQSVIQQLQSQVQEGQNQQALLEAPEENQIEAYRNDLINWYQQQATLKNQLQQHQVELQQATVKAEQLTKELTQLTTEATELKDQRAQLQQEQADLQQQITQSTTHIENVQTNLADQTAQAEQLQQQLFTSERQLQMLTGKVTSLKQLEANYSGYYAGVRALMQHQQQFEGIDGTVAELMSVPKDYQTAIETALGGSLQQIVVQNDQVARQAINYLRKNRLGRATLLPRTNLRKRTIRAEYLQSVQSSDGFVGIAHELVQVEPQNQLIAEHLLGATVVMTHLKEAQELARHTKHRLRIVTLDGEILNPGGSVSGGSHQQETSLLGREREIKSARQELSKATSAHKQLEAGLQTIQQVHQQSTEQLSQLEKERTTLQSAKQEYTQQLQQVTYTSTQIEKSQQLVRQDLQALEEDSASSLTTQKELEAELQAVQATIEQKNLDLEKLNLDQDDRQAMQSRLQQTLNELTTSIAVKQTEAQGHAQEIKRVQAELKDINQWLSTDVTTVAQEQQIVEQLEATIADLSTTIQALEASQATQQASLQKKRAKRITFNEAIGELEDSIQMLQTSNQDEYQIQATLTAEINQLAKTIEQHLTHLNNEYRKTYEAAKEQAVVIKDIQLERAKVERLKSQINALGPINLASIEDYDILNKRFEHLKNEETDLTTAIEQLEATIVQMDQEVTTRFKDTFETINDQFKLTFQKLFGGGQAALQLTNPEDLLTTGIDIIAQPPGKKKQNLSLLSGGERSLTAIALLFAILETHPVPFVLLDEVEAALDEANVSRFGQYLQSFTDQTQFIVITHRRGTMEHADILYGVTMEQSGVSKLASVRLTDVELDDD